MSRELTLLLTEGKGPVGAPVRSALGDLFALPLEEVRLEPMPDNAAAMGLFSYLCPGPNGTLHLEDFSADLLGKLRLTLRPPPGERVVDADPGLGVVRYNGRIYLRVLAPVVADAARAIHSGTKPRFRPVPLGTHFADRGRILIDGTWLAAQRWLDNLEKDRP